MYCTRKVNYQNASIQGELIEKFVTEDSANESCKELRSQGIRAYVTEYREENRVNGNQPFNTTFFNK